MFMTSEVINRREAWSWYKAELALRAKNLERAYSNTWTWGCTGVLVQRGENGYCRGSQKLNRVSVYQYICDKMRAAIAHAGSG
jgi:hypothetical protein